VSADPGAIQWRRDSILVPMLPLLLGLLIVVHVYLFRRAGPGGAAHNWNDQRVDRFSRKQLLKDSLVAMINFGALLALARLRVNEMTTGNLCAPISS